MKEINVIAFGAAVEITGNKTFVLNEVDTTDSLIKLLETQYPGLKGMKYSIAVNKQIVKANTVLEHNATVAILPPFSGG